MSDLIENKRVTFPPRVSAPELYSAGVTKTKKDKDGNIEEWLDPDRSINYAAMLMHHHAFKGIFAFDEFALSPIMIKCPDWFDAEEKRKFVPHKVESSDIIATDYQLQKFLLNGSREKTKDAIYMASRKNTIHPARDYFQRLRWDGKPRLGTWLREYCGAVDDDAEYLAAVGTKWMCAAVGRVMNPGCKFDNMLIFEGNQDTFKSTTFRELATFGDEGSEIEYFTDGFQLANADNKDELAKLAGVLIVEIAELDGFHKRENTFLKAFISRQKDQYRIPYGAVVETFPRQFVFGGSYNPQGGITTDPTGARRFWFVKVGPRIDIAAIKKNKNQMWAEAVHRYKNGEVLYLSDNLKTLAADAAAKRRIIDDWSHDVIEAVGKQEFIEVRNVMKALNLEIRNRTSKESRRISDILRSNGWQYVRRMQGGKQVYGWENPHSPWAQKAKQIEIEIPLVPPQPAKDYDDVD